MPRTSRYETVVTWTGNCGNGTSGYRAYQRRHEISAEGKTPIPGSADPSRCGAPDRWNPEELLVASVAGCHMLWYLHLCVGAGIVVTDYVDRPYGVMVEALGGSGQFIEVRLRPRVTVAAAEHTHPAFALHERAHERCFIANSVNFPVRHEPVVRAEPIPHASGLLEGRVGQVSTAPTE